MTLVVLDGDGPARSIARVPEGEATREHPLRDLIFDNPAILPLTELDPGIGRIVPVAKELNLPGSGFIDVLLVSEHGRLIVVECKLWRNPQARREVVGQVLDYAGELARIGYEGLQRAISSRLKRQGNLLHELITSAGGAIPEATLVDRVDRDLAAGRFLLLIVGDGITEGAQRIGAFLTRHAGLAFDLAMIEIAEYREATPGSTQPRRILHPRILARTAVIERHVIRNEVPNAVIEPISDADEVAPTRPAGSGANAEAISSWRRFVDRFARETQFDDPAQLPPRVGGVNWMRMPLHDDLDTTLYRSSSSAEVGAFVRFRGPEASAWYEALQTEAKAIDAEFAEDALPTPNWTSLRGENTLTVTSPSPLPWTAEAEAQQQAWMARVANRLINSLKPRLAQLTEPA
jgi:hypothetical protein